MASERQIGFVAATGVGVGAIVGGGITRVATEHNCASVLLGLPRLDERDDGGPFAQDLETLLGELGRDVVIVRSPPDFQLGKVKRILVAMGHKLEHDALRARLLGSLLRTPTAAKDSVGLESE